MDYHPKNLDVKDEDLAQARKIIAANDDLIIRYLRKDRSVHFAKVPVRDENGAIITQDVSTYDEAGNVTGSKKKWITKNKLVICSGIPTGVLVAVKVNEALRIGWSRRMDAVKLIGTRDLTASFEEVVSMIRGVKDDNYDKVFASFCAQMVHIMSSNPQKDVEVSFSKEAGREAAVLRALLDEITVYKRVCVSNASGPIPNEVARGLRWFVQQAEEAFGQEAENYFIGSNDDKVIVPSKGNAVVAI